MKSPIEKEFARSKPGSICGFCSRPDHNIRTCEVAKEAQNSIGIGPSKVTTTSFNPNFNPSDSFQENTESEAISGNFQMILMT